MKLQTSFLATIGLLEQATASVRNGLRGAVVFTAVFLAALISADTALGQAFNILVTKNGDRFDEREALGIRDLRAGQDLDDVRVEILDVNGDTFTSFNRNVRLELRTRSGGMEGAPDQRVTVNIPAAEFVDGVAENISVPLIYAANHVPGFNKGVHFWATDGNIITHNASGYFTVWPEDFEVSYRGSARPLGAHPIMVGTGVQLRIRALNADGSTAIGYTGDVGYSVVDPGDPLTILGAGSAFLLTGRSDSVSTMVLSDEVDGAVVTVFDLSTFDPDTEDYFLTTEDASGPFDVFTRGSGFPLTVDRVERRGDLFPGRNQSIRFRLNNASDNDDQVAPVDTLFRLMRGDDLIFQWWHRLDRDVPAGENSGDLFTSFIIPQALTAAEYTVQIRPAGSTTNEETVDIPITVTPDLAIYEFTYTPGEYRGGDAVRFNLSFLNRTTYAGTSTGTSAIPPDQPFRVQIHLSANGFYGDDDDFLVWEGSFEGGAGIQPIGSPAFDGNQGGLFLAPGQPVTIDDQFLLPKNFDGTFFVMARVNSAPGRDGEGFENENSRGTTPRWGNNTTFGEESQKITVLPVQGTDTFRVSVDEDGGQSSGLSDNPVISRNGRFVAFESFAALTEGATEGVRNIFVRNIDGSNTLLVTPGADGPAQGHSGAPSITDNGRYVVFHSQASNLVADDTNGFSDIFVRDMQLGITRRLSVNPNPVSPTLAQANNGSQLAQISGDGRFVVFESNADNLITPRPDGVVRGRTQIYLYDRDVSGTGVFDVAGNTAIHLVSQSGGTAGSLQSTNPKLSRDGSHVAFVTRAPNLLGGIATQFNQIVLWSRETNEILPISVAFEDDVWSSVILGNNISGFPAINGNGEFVAFASRAQNMTRNFDPENPDLGGDRYESSIPHIFRARIQDGQVTEILRMNAADGSEPDNPLPFASIPDLGAYEPSLSEDGMLLTFASESQNLLPPILVRNLDRTDFTISQPFSNDGRHFVPNLTSDVYFYRDDNFSADVYLYDLSNPDQPDIRRASVSRFGFGGIATSLEGANRLTLEFEPISRKPSISPDGRFIAFTNEGKGFNGLIFGDTNWEFEATNAVRDVLVFDLKGGLSIPEELPEVEVLEPFSLDVAAGSSIQLQAVASSGFRSIETVEFYANNQLIGTATEPSFPNTGYFTIDWQVPTPGTGNVSILEYGVTAIAIDSNGLKSPLSNIRTFRALPPVGTLPSITIASPTATTAGEPPNEVTIPASFSSNSRVTLVAAVSPGSSSVTQVTFHAVGVGGSSLLGTGVRSSDGLRYTLPYNNALPVGDYSLVAIARDGNGNVVQSPLSPLTVTLATSNPPTVPAVTVTPSSVVLNDIIQITANPTPAGGAFIESVQFFINGRSVALLDEAPFQIDFLANVTGPLAIYAVVRDNLGGVRASSTVTVTVSGQGDPTSPIDPADPANAISFVELMYNDLLGRDPTSAELASDQRRLTRGDITRDQLINNLLRTPSFELRRWVISAYYTVVGVPPTQAQLLEGEQLLLLGDEAPDDIPEEIFVQGPALLPVLVSNLLNSPTFRSLHLEDKGLIRWQDLGNEGLFSVVYRQNLQRSRPSNTVLQNNLNQMQFSRVAWTTNQIPDNPPMRKASEVVALILLVMGNEEVDPDQFDALFALSNPAAKVLESQDFVGRFNEEANFFGLDQPGGFGMVKHGWFGEFRDNHFSYVARQGLIDHKEHGWLWAAGIGHPNGGIWLWDYIQEDWIWTRSDVHPFFYSNNHQRWFYYEVGGQPSSRWFYDYDISAWLEVN